MQYVPGKSPHSTEPGLRRYVETEFQNIARALREQAVGIGVSVEDYGADPTGETDSTEAIQTALNSGASYVHGEPGSTYLVSHAATFLVNATAYRRCVAVPAGVTFDGRGATIVLDDAQNSSPVALLGDGAACIDWTIDCNRDNQTSPATGELANVVGYNASRLFVSRVVLTNARQYAARMLLCPDGRFDMRCTDSFGDGISLGTTVGLECERVLALVEAEDCEGAYALLEGNGIIGACSGTIFARAKDCGGGNKFQNTLHDLEVFADFDGDDQTFGSANSGNKLQGFQPAALYPARIKAHLTSRNAFGNGLFITEIDSVELVSYFGYHNGHGASGSDQNDAELRLDNGRGHLSIGLMHIEDPAAAGVRRTGAGVLSFDSITVVNPTGIAFQDTSSGETYGRLLYCLDEAGTPTTTFVFSATSSVRGRIDQIATNLESETTQQRVTIVGGNYGLEIGSIRLGSSDELGGVVTLTNGGTTTAVACGHVWRHTLGGTEYFHPIIQIMPWDASARALSGNYGAVVADGSSGTGFTMQHPSAGADDKVFWRVAGWRVVSSPQA